MGLSSRSESWDHKGIFDEYFRHKRMLRVWIISLIFSICVVTGSSKPTRKGFILGNATIPIKDIKDGGPRKDEIPAIDNPSFLSIAEVDYLKAEDQVMSITHDGISRAYPIRILDHHEIVNDKIGDLAFAVTYCPLCGSGMIFNRKIKGEETTFGVSGLLYQSDVLLYDRATACGLNWLPNLLLVLALTNYSIGYLASL
jgi:hypothetical protein